MGNSNEVRPKLRIEDLIVVLLQSKDRFAHLLLLDVPTGGMLYLERNESTEHREIDGTYAKIAGHCLTFYRLDSKLRFGLDKKSIVIDDVTKVYWSKIGTAIAFSIEKNQEEVLRFQYSQDDLEQPIPGDTTAHVSEEDFDFGLFVYNVLNDPKRRESIYQHKRSKFE